MFTASKSRRRSGYALAVLFVCCLPTPAFSDEFQYLPDNVRVIGQINVTKGAKTKTFEEFMKMTKAFAPKDEDNPVDAFVAKISRATIGVGMLDTKTDKGRSTEEIEIATAIKPITIDDVKALKKPAAFKKNQTFKEIKHGSVRIYQETYQTQVFKDGKDDEVGKVIEREAFYLPEGGKYIVSSRQVDNLKKIIDRNKAPKLSPVMQAALKDAGSSSTVTVAVDLKNLPADHRANMHRGFASLPGYDDIKAEVDKAQSLTVKLDEPNGKFKAVVTLTCGDKANAAAIKAGADKALALLRAKANEDPKGKLPPEAQKFLDGARTALKAIQVSSAGAKVTASVELEPEIAVNALAGFAFVARTSEPAPAEKFKDEKNRNK